MANIIEAIRALEAGTTPGTDGIPIDWYKLHAAQQAPLLSELFAKLLRRGELTEGMKEGVITLLYKNKEGASPEDIKQYRPVAVTQAMYRILGRAIAQRLAFTIGHVIGDEQAGFTLLRKLEENTILANELLHHTDSQGEGAFVLVDQTKAFDKVQWSFLNKTI